MASSKTVVAGVIGFVLGAATMGVLLSLLATPEPAPPVAVVPTAPPPEAPEEVPEEPTPPPAPVEPAKETPVEAAEPEPPPAPAEPERPTRGTGTIQGVVRTTNGTPIVGVVVRATVRDPEARWRVRGGGGPPPQRDPQEAAENVRWRNAAAREATTDVAGRYEVDGLLDMPFGMQAWYEGYEVRPAGKTWETRPGATFDFVAKPVAGVRVSVLRPDGAVHDEATLDWRLTGPRGGGQTAMWSATEPVVDIEPGTYDVTVRSRGDDPYHCEPVRVTVPANADGVPEVEIHLTVNTTIAGTVVVAPDQAWQYVAVWIAPLAPGADPARTASAAMLSEDRSRRTGARAPDYSFQLTGLSPGRYVLAAAVGPAHQVVEVQEGRNEVSLRIPKLGPLDVLAVDVRGPDGGPVPDLEFLYEERGYSSMGRGLRGSQQPDGSWRLLLAGVRSSGKPRTDVEYALTVTSAEFGSREVPLRPGSGERLSVSFTAPATLRVTTPGFPGAYPDGLLTLVLVGRGANDAAITQASIQARQDALTGRAWEPDAVEPGEYDLVLAWSPDRRQAPRRLARVPLTLTAGETVHDLVPPALHTLTVRLDAADPGSRVGILPASQRPGSGGWTADVDADGRATFDSLGAGSYVLGRAIDGERREMVVEVAGDMTVAWAPVPLNGLRITEVVRGGYLHTAGFRVGDVITYIDGEEFDTTRLARERFHDAARKPSYEVTVQRGSSVIRLEVTGAKMNDRRAFGGHWVPVSR